MSTRTVLVVASPDTSDQAVESLAAPLRAAGGDVTVVDLRAPGTRTATGRLAAALSGTTASWSAARRVTAAQRAQLRDAELVVAADRTAVPAVWRTRRTNPSAALVNGVPAGQRVLAGRR
ncbi:NAD(P)H-dependent oxidoreductase [Cellulomonas uda]|uniref:Uncharacterized protein n=1 Tax=Cellulomonas uda TaxID=1714 RepID=A0A4Y3K8W3_CELUD|nr:NAD(P)H-dependent oxidoreductase [Cellulomonas uda]NII65285.1 hypothetical protein [Cellulomonas uda]GEA79814.1 hypothetical protein CUD01_02580 [Cellulomonas uda]